MATVDSDGNIRYVYRNSICEYTGGNDAGAIDGWLDSNLQLEWASVELRIEGRHAPFVQYAGTPAKLACVYLPDDTRLTMDRDQKWCHINNAGTILRDVDGEPFVAPDGKLWLRGKDGIFSESFQSKSRFPLEGTAEKSIVQPCAERGPSITPIGSTLIFGLSTRYDFSRENRTGKS